MNLGLDVPVFLPGELKANEAVRGPFLHSGRGRIFDFLLCSEEGLGNGTSYTPKAVTLIETLSRA